MLLLKAAGLSKGSSNPKKDRVAELSRDKIREIAQIKMADLNAAPTPTLIPVPAG